MHTNKFFLFVLYFSLSFGIHAEDACSKDAKTMVSWNAENFGSKKSDETIRLMARILTAKGIEYREKKKIVADIILLQEVNSRVQSGGPQSVSRLQDALGQDWDSIISDPTTGDGVERYALLWLKPRFLVNRREATLVKDLADVIDREPFGVRLSMGNKSFWTYGFHAVPTAKNPISEAKLVARSQEITARENIILAGDFNLGRVTIVGAFPKWKDHIDEKTSLKSTVGTDGGYRSYQYDHILTKGTIRVCESGVIDFVSTHFSPISPENLKRARQVSDHLPVYIRFTIEGKKSCKVIIYRDGTIGMYRTHSSKKFPLLQWEFF